MQLGSRTAGVWLTAGAIAVAVSLAVSSCSSTSAPNTSEKSQGKLVVGITSDPDTLFPWKATQFQAVNVLQTMYSTLTNFDKKLDVVPGIAKSWKVSDDGLSITFTLRKGVKFADGSALDSTDVKDSFDKIKLESTAAVARATLASVSSIEAPDPETVKLTLSSPDAGLLANLASINMAILSSTDTEAALTAKPNGSGPYEYTSRVPNQSITLKENKDYWGGKPGLSAVEFRIIPDETSIVSALQAGNVQFAVFDDALVAKTAETGTTKVTKTPQLSYHALQLNARKGPLTDLNVRLAIQCAVDRKQVLDTAALGEGEVTGPITSPAYRSDPHSRPCPKVDLAKSKSYLAKAGLSGGVTIKTIVSTGEYSTSVNEAQNLKAQLAKAGITLDLEVLESGAYVDRWIAGDFEAAVALNGGRPDPDGMYGRYFTSTGNLNAVAGYSSPELDALFAQGRSTSDVAARKKIYTKVSDNLENNAAWIWMFTSYTYTASAAGVKGFEPMANGSLQYLATTTNSK
jgi:peptide/nickel transport system substrate-binding protein